jgi:hypothetical protein
MIRGLVLAIFALASLSVAHAAEMEGVTLPDTREIAGAQMRLNGMGLRTYSILGIRIYVAGLYLERPNNNPDAILQSPERKLLEIHFLRDVGVEDARKAWKDGFTNNCKAPCSVDPADLARFLEQVPPVRKGDVSMMVFSPKGAAVTFNGRPMGVIDDAHFATTMLATFIGPEPPTKRLKRELLGLRD